jgi:hypothetical protein
MRKWVGILLIVLAACIAVQVPASYGDSCDPSCPAPPK